MFPVRLPGIIEVNYTFQFLKGHFRAFLLISHKGIYLVQTPVQAVLTGCNSFADRRVCLCKQVFVKVIDLEEISLVAKGVRHGKDGRIAQIAVPVHLFHMACATSCEAE